MSRTTRLFICLIALLTLFSLLWPGQVEASRLAACLSNVTVANTNDSGSGSLRQALADVCSGGTVDFAAGLANQTITLTSAELSITKTVTITNPNAANLQVSGNNARRVFNIQAGAVVTMSSLSIISGTVMGECDCGGGILVNSAATLVLNRSTIKDNWNADYGAGIFNSGTVTINDSTLTGNYGIYEGGGISNEGIMTVTNSVFNGNSAGWYYGAGGGLSNNGTLTILNSIFGSNSASYGGGINNGGIMTVTNSTLSNNSANSQGGGIRGNGTITINNSTLSGNSASDGGGVYRYYDGVLTINNSTLSGNSAGSGGGIGKFNGTVIINNSSIISNSSGIQNWYPGALYLRNSIVAYNNNGDCYNFGTIAVNIKNLITDGSCAPALSGNPIISPLQNNGGSTLTHALLPGSPAIDAGDNTSCLTIDQRGISRPIDGNGDSVATCDIGAVEASGGGSPSPNIQILGNNYFISDEDDTPSLVDHTDFGSTPVIGGTITRTFIISNTGLLNLMLTGSPLVTITGDVTDFSVTILPGTLINPGNHTTFQIRFDPTEIGLRTATLIIANNDPDSNPYNFRIQGTGGCFNAITVTNTNDSGPGTLRQALSYLCSDGTITFAPELAHKTIVLTSTELSISKALTITNLSAPNLQVSGNNAYRVFRVQGDSNTNVTINNLRISNGLGSIWGGGGILNYSVLTLNQVILDGNSAHIGGGIYNEGTLIIRRSIVRNNSAIGVGYTGNGGGIENNNILNVEDSLFTDNTADEKGGAIINYGTLTVNNSTFSGNSAALGGALNNYYGSWRDVVLTVNNSTFSDNSASLGAGIYNSRDFNLVGKMYLHNNIVANSFIGEDCFNDGIIEANLNNLMESGNCSPMFSDDPRLDQLSDNGGATLTHALLPGSPAIDAGDNAACLSSDQRGFSRPQDGDNNGTAVCDIGAFEVLDLSIPTIHFTQAVYTTTENIGTSQSIILTRIGNLANASQVQVSLSGGTATAGTDYSSAGFPKTITFASGVVSQTVPIAITNDTQVELSETISLTLSPLGNAIIGTPSSAVLRIEDNDSAAASFKVYLPTVIK